jgi:hypothetical protein
MSEPAVVLGALATTSASAPAPRTGRVNTAVDLARLRAEGTILTAIELKELNARIKTLEDMAKLEDRLRLLENRKRTSEAITGANSQEDPFIRNPSLAGFSGYQASVVRQSIKPGGSDNSESSSETVNRHRHKRQRNNRGIKIILLYTLKVNSSLREWGD